MQKNLYNSALFRIRQVRSGIGKSQRHPNEEKVFGEIETFIDAMNEIRHRTYLKKLEKNPNAQPRYFSFPSEDNFNLGYEFLNALFLVSKNKDYKALPAHATQNVIKNVCTNVESYYAAHDEYQQNPKKFTGEPRFPGYAKERKILTFSNIECKILKSGWLRFPKTDIKYDLRKIIDKGLLEKKKLMQVSIVPYYRKFELVLVFEDQNQEQKSDLQGRNNIKRVAGIDFGVKTLIAMANNIGLPGVLFNDGRLRSWNQDFNKKYSKIRERYAKHNEEKSFSSKRMDLISQRRNGSIRTLVNTIAKRIVNLLVEWKIEALVVGTNKGWKQNTNIGRKNNQVFVQIPFDRFRQALKYRCQKAGILYNEQEESYTSQASFLDNDPIPVYDSEKPKKYRFSGKRNNRRYTTASGKIVHADMNAAANIIRKAFPDAFTDSAEIRFFDSFSHIDLGEKMKPKDLKKKKTKRMPRVKRNPERDRCPVNGPEVFSSKKLNEAPSEAKRQVG